MKQDRLAQIIEHNQEMIKEINSNIDKGIKYYSHTFLGKLEINYITPDLWINTGKQPFPRSFAIHGGELKELYETHEIK